MKNEFDRLGVIIKSARRAKHLTREQLAAALDISSRHLSAIENENQKPSYELLYHLIRELSIPADTIFYPELGYKPSELARLRLLLAQCDEKEVNAVAETLQSLLKSDENRC
jgi:transcriptional regulator with XRE-family HTH domain